MTKANLSYEYNTNIQFRTAILCLKSTVFVPSNSFNDEFYKLVAVFCSFNDNRVSFFVENSRKNYVIGVDGKLFLKREYQHQLRLLKGLPLTSNHAEAYNNAISKDLNYSKVSVCQFVECLRKRQGFFEIDIRNVLASPGTNYQKNKQKEKMNKLVKFLLILTP